jgi:hypothetical protein
MQKQIIIKIFLLLIHQIRKLILPINDKHLRISSHD